jgi:SAM-dependent methyltransferase
MVRRPSGRGGAQARKLEDGDVKHPADGDPRALYYREEADEGSFVSAGYSQRVLRELYGRLHRIGGARILRICDIGSGAGLNLPALRNSFPDARLVSVDLNLPALRRGRGREPAARAVAGDALALPVRSGSFDLAVCTEVLEHVSSIERALEEMARVLGPGGYAAVSSPNYLNAMGVRKWMRDRRYGAEQWDPWEGHPGFERLMLPAKVRKAAAPFFRIEAVRGAGFLMAWLPLGYRRIGRLHDAHPLVALGRLPVARDTAMNRYLLLRKR